VKPDFSEWSAAVQVRIERALNTRLPAAEKAPQRLHLAMRHSALGGGKRIRPLLTFAAGELVGGDAAALDHCACAVEAIHVYSLIHDDLPCMDNDTLRRGRPTCHVAFDEATALLAGDALQSLAFEWLAETPCAPERRVRMLRLLARSAGPAGMAGGQAIDLAAVGQPQALTLPDLEFMHALKTGALIRSAILLGAECGREPLSAGDFEALDQFSKRVGLLFQVVDDILDCTASTATLGKTSGKDVSAGKPTYVTLLGLAQAKAMAAELHAGARASLATLSGDTTRLFDLCDFVAHRSF
jgi:farnesyl diphosphate synthase